MGITFTAQDTVGNRVSLTTLMAEFESVAKIEMYVQEQTGIGEKTIGETRNRKPVSRFRWRLSIDDKKLAEGIRRQDRCAGKRGALILLTTADSAPSITWLPGIRMTQSRAIALVRREDMNTAKAIELFLESCRLRHTFGMQYMLKGGDVFSLQRIMGRRRPETTMIYVNMPTDLVAQQHRKFSPFADIEITQDW